MTTTNFHEAIATLLGKNLEQYKKSDQNLTPDVCIQIYTTIFETITDLFKETKAPVGNEAANYVAQQYYDGILINNTHELDPNIFDQRAQLENIPTKELAFLALLLKDTDFRFPVLAEIKKRS